MERIFQVFQPIGSGVGSVDIAAAEAIFREDLPRAYQLPAGSRLSIRPGRALSAQEEALLDELVQHLIDLAYLPESFHQDYFDRPQPAVSPEQWRSIHAALLELVQEDDWARQAGLLGQAFSDRDTLLQADGMLPLLVQRLNRLVSLDGELLLSRPLKLGEKSGYSRALMYRLRSLGQYFDGEAVPVQLGRPALIRAFNVLILLGLKKREEIDFKSDELPPEFFQLLGDAHRMFGHYLQGHEDRVLFCQLPEAAEPLAQSQWLIAWKGSFVYAGSEQAFQRQARRQTTLDYESLKLYLQRRGTAATVFHTAQNILGLRLVQLKLWMAGFYYGRIDGWWGPLSHQALLDFLEQEGVDKDKELGRFIAPVEDNYRAVNLARLGALLSAYDAPAAKAPDQERQLMEALAVEDEEAVQTALYSGDGNIRAFYRESRKNRRRLYFGIRSLAASALRGVKKVLGWIKRKVQKVVGAVISFFKAVAKRIREGILLFAESFRRFLHFVLQKPVVSPEVGAVPAGGPFVLTRFAVDSDVVNLHSASVSPALMAAHLSLVRRLTAGLSLFLAIATEVIHLIAILGTLATPVGWIKLGFWIAGKVEEVLNRK